MQTGFDSVVVYRQNGTPSGDDVMFALSAGGGFAAPFFLTTDAVVDTNPDCVYTSTGLNEFVWESLPPPGTPQIYVFRDTLLPVLVGAGSNPSVADTGGGSTFIAYVRNGDIYGRFHAGGGVLSPEVTVSTLAGGNSDIRVAGDSTGLVHTIFINNGTLYYRAGFQPPVSLGPVDGAASLFVGPDDIAVVGYTTAGVTYVIRRNGSAFTLPVALSAPGAVTSQGAVARDSFGYYHASWVDGGEVYYYNNVPAPTADFSADVLSGQQALGVQFTNLSSGPIDSYEWDFGDGTTSSLATPVHSYEAIGVFTVTLTVTGPGGSDTMVKTDYIDVQPATHILTLPDIEVLAGSDVVHPVLATHTQAMEGFTVAISYDSTLISNLNVTLTGSLTAPLFPELFIVGDFPVGPNSTLIHTILMEVAEPFDGLAIHAGANQRISNIEYTVSPTAPVGTVIPFTLMDGLQTPPMNNVFAQDGTSTNPFLQGGSVTVVAAPQNLFLRGDASGDNSVDIGDAVAVLSALFSSIPLGGCPDAADANDSGQINIADPVAILNFLFGGGQQLMYPSPFCGLDPTPDNLDCIQNYCP